MMVERANLGDVDAIYSVVIEASRWLAARGVRQWGLDYPRSLITQEVEAGVVFVHRSAGELAGTVTLNPAADSYWPSERAARPALYLHRLAVPRSHAGRGLGRRMIEWSERECRSRGISCLRLDCHSSNSVLRDYYGGQGFRFLETQYDPHWKIDFALFEKEI